MAKESTASIGKFTPKLVSPVHVLIRYEGFYSLKNPMQSLAAGRARYLREREMGLSVCVLVSANCREIRRRESIQS